MSMVPVVASMAELPDAIKYADRHPEARWFVSRRAAVFDAADQVPAEWGEAITAAVAAADLDTEQRDALAKKGIALKDGSFPIRNRTDLAKAIRALGRAKNRAAAKRHILKRARALHSTDLLPDSYKPLTSATVSPDEVGLWVAQVRDLIAEAGGDPDALEANTDGFAADFEEYKDTPAEYVAELLAADHEPDGDEADDSDEETTEPEPDGVPVTEPEATAVPVQSVPLAAATTTTSSVPYVNVYTSAPAPAPAEVKVDMDALLAAVKAAVKDEVSQAMAASTPATEPDPETDDPEPTDPTPEPEPVSAASTDVPVDVDAAKAALRDRFGAHPKKKRKAPPVPDAAMPPVLSSVAMRERIAARTAS